MNEDEIRRYLEDVLGGLGQLVDGAGAKRNANIDAFVRQAAEARAKKGGRKARKPLSWEVVRDGDRVVLRTPDGKRWRVSAKTAAMLARKLSHKANDAQGTDRADR